MKYFILLMILSSSCFSYDGRIKDVYGRTVGYISLDKDKEEIHIYDIKGVKQYEIDNDFEIDEKGKIQWDI